MYEILGLLAIRSKTSSRYVDDGDDDDDDDDGFCGTVDRQNTALFSVGTIVRDPHHRKSPIHREQDMNLRRT